jgi:hypothetical protein
VHTKEFAKAEMGLVEGDDRGNSKEGSLAV